MNEDPYTNREIREMVKDIHDSLGRIESQTIKTNGRVNLLEAREHENRGRWNVITWVGVPLISLLIGWGAWITMQVVSDRATLSAQIQNGISAYFQNYQIMTKP